MSKNERWLPSSGAWSTSRGTAAVADGVLLDPKHPENPLNPQPFSLS